MVATEHNLFRRLHALTMRELEATITQAEHAQLEHLLLESSAARQMYLEYLQDTACLRWLCVEELASRVEAKALSVEPERTPARGWLHPAAVLAVVACSLLLLAWWAGNAPRDARSRAVVAGQSGGAGSASADFSQERHEATSGVATVTGLDSARWRQAAEGGRLLARCQVGQRWQLVEGRAELTFDTGALVTIFAPAEFDIVSANSIRCRHGRITALVDERGKGFTIETPQAKVVDLGTQFGVDIKDDGETQVVVFHGSVDLTYAAASSARQGKRSRRLVQGDALLLKNTGELQRVMAVRRDKFLVAAGGSVKRPPVILDVRDNIRKGQSVKSYQIVHGGFGEDVPCFVDRDHEWNGIDESGLPEFLLGADYIMPFNDDKFLRNLQLEVHLSRPATLYLFFDDNMEVPEWLSHDFTHTGFHIGLDGATTKWHPENALGTGPGVNIDFTFSVWRREIKRPGVVTLGGVKPPRNRPMGFNMYGVAAVATQ